MEVCMCAFSTILRMGTAYASIAFFLLRIAVIVMQIGLIPLVSHIIGKVHWHCDVTWLCNFRWSIKISVFIGIALFKPVFCHYWTACFVLQLFYLVGICVYLIHQLACLVGEQRTVEVGEYTETCPIVLTAKDRQRSKTQYPTQWTPHYLITGGGGGGSAVTCSFFHSRRKTT